MPDLDLLDVLFLEQIALLNVDAIDAGVEPQAREHAQRQADSDGRRITEDRHGWSGC